MSTESNNKLIAEFLCTTQKTEGLDDCYIFKGMAYHIEDLAFNSDWNWLMKVVEKIDDVCGIDLHEWDEHINNALCSKSLHTTYNACIEFIKWHNEQK